MIDSSIEELFNTINDSNEYKEYLSIVDKLNSDKAVIGLIDEIKKLEKEATMLEYSGDSGYKDIDKIIEEKVKELNGNPLYIDYLSRLKEFNSTLMASSSLLNDYIDSKLTN